MRLLALLAMVLLPLSAFAQSTPPMPGTSDTLTVVRPAPGIDYYSSPSGQSVTVVEPMKGLRWYSAQDPHGRITAQGYLFDPLPTPQSLRVPESMRAEPPERRR
jgi:hypothetical protein